MISSSDYFGEFANHPDATPDRKLAADVLLEKVNALLERAWADGVDEQINPATNSQISGKTYGGFRPMDCTVGAKNSSHKYGMAVDVYDPTGELDQWCFTHQAHLKELGLHMEAPQATSGWCHLTTRPPASGKVCFMP